MAQHAPARRRTAPVHPRRVSGPMRPRAVPAVALPAPGAFERLRALPDKRVVDRLLRGRLCIWVIGVLLGGIVAMQVSLLRMNAGISRAVSTASLLEQRNSDLEAENSRLTTGDRVRTFALDNGMIDPAAGDASFLTARPGTDADLAIKRMTPPSETAMNVMAGGGTLPSATATPAATTPVTATTPTTQVAATPTPAPTVTQAQVTPTPTPVPTTVPGTDGAAVAPQG